MITTTASKNSIKVGFYSSWSLAVLTIITFGLGIMAVPPAGPYCISNCMDYPYPDILNYFPRDYFWMYCAIFQLCAFLIFMIANHFFASEEKKIFSFISFSFSLIATIVLLSNYFLQFSVVPISVLQGQMEGIALLTQYNGHGVFIVLEELGFTMMSIGFLFLSPIYSLDKPLEKVIRWFLVLPFSVNIIMFAYYSVIFGLDRNYRYEVATISINWLVTIIVSILLGIFYDREMKKRLLAE